MKKALDRHHLVVILILLVSSSVTGCARDYLARRRQPRNPLANALGLFTFSGPKPSERTRKIIHQYGLDDEGSESVLTRLEQEIAKDPTPEKVYAFAELSYIA